MKISRRLQILWTATAFPPLHNRQWRAVAIGGPLKTNPIDRNPDL